MDEVNRTMTMNELRYGEIKKELDQIGVIEETIDELTEKSNSLHVDRRNVQPKKFGIKDEILIAKIAEYVKDYEVQENELNSLVEI